MEKRKSRLLDLAVVIIIIILTLPVFAFCLGGASGFGGAWIVQPRTTPSGEVRLEYGVFKLEYGEKQTVAAVYVNAAKTSAKYGEKTEFIFDFTDSESQAKTTSYISARRKIAELESSEKTDYKFINVLKNVGEGAKYVRVGVKNSVRVNEIVFVDKNDEPVKAVALGALTWKENKYGYFDKSELGSNGADCATDAYGSLEFSSSGAVIFSDKQAELAAAANSFLYGDGYAVSSSHSPLGVVITALGLLLFGTGLFGLCFFNYIALIISLCIVYFAAKNIFENRVYAYVCVALFALCFCGISSAIGASAANLALPPILGGVYSAYIYVKSPMKNSKSIALSGVLFSFAIAIDFHAIVSLLALLAFAVYGAKREISSYSGYEVYGGLEREYARVKYKKHAAFTVFKLVACFLLLPALIQVISYGITFISYSAYYADYNIFAIAAKNNNALFFAKSENSSLIFSWLIGLGGEGSKLYGENATKICANALAVIIGTASVAYVCVTVCRAKIKSKQAGGVVTASKKTHLENAAFLAVWFISCFLTLTVFGFLGEYCSFLYAQAAYGFLILFAFKTSCAKNEKATCYCAVLACVLVVLLEAVCFTEIFQLDFFPSINTVILNGIKGIF